MNSLFLLTVTACVVLGTDGVRVLSIIPFHSRSHYNVYEPLLKRLAEKGHEVVSVSHFPQKSPLSNFTDVSIASSVSSQVRTIRFMDFGDQDKWYNIRTMLNACGVSLCDPVLNHPNLKKLIQSKEKFDLFIVEVFASECFLAIAHVLKIPIVVGGVTTNELPWTNYILRNPENPSYIPNSYSKFTDRMNLLERTNNFISIVVAKLCYRFFSDEPSYEIAKKHFGDDLPDFDALRSRISLILTNGHPAVSVARPLAPGYKELGGIHIPMSGPPPLPKDLQDYLDSHGKDGVIYFSLGSQIDMSTMPRQVFAAFYRAFEQVPQQILWKCSRGKMPTLPKNVKCIEWAPQLSVLCHPNVHLFISHGGLLGTQEAVYCGVPILGIPLFGDQFSNMAYFVKKGLALQLDFSQLSYERISNALSELLVNKSYKEAAQKASLQFKDRPIPPLEEATYWIEYLIRHGSNSLKTEASNLSWYQYLLLDVIFVITIPILLIVWIVYKLLKLILCRTRTIDREKKTK
ncbi:UDP-glucosyltransferase 2-like [Colletes gigas]|uniref:UDP-glucosyltransferase 2-like n=1 Tax=Colletes gigas TaxID=935657 RepID=UPI001C9ACFFB|nr:UDP-glucosyltransferase 2-like [Colletes gigas]